MIFLFRQKRNIFIEINFCSVQIKTSLVCRTLGKYCLTFPKKQLFITLCSRIYNVMDMLGLLLIRSIYGCVEDVKVVDLHKDGEEHKPLSPPPRNRRCSSATALPGVAVQPR